MHELKLKILSSDEYDNNIKESLQASGICKTLEEYCNKINEEASGLDYASCGFIQENLCDILRTAHLASASYQQVAGKLNLLLSDLEECRKLAKQGKNYFTVELMLLRVKEIIEIMEGKNENK